MTLILKGVVVIFLVLLCIAALFGLMFLSYLAYEIISTHVLIALSSIIDIDMKDKKRERRRK